MATKQVMFDQNALIEMKKGVDRLADAVKVTMGPSGRHVVIQKSFGGPSVTKDGVSVSKEVDLPERFAAMGAKMVNEVAKKANDKAGDGTTAATVLAQAIFNSGLRYAISGANTVQLQRGINNAASVAAEYITSIANPCKGKADLQKIATVSANHNAQVGELIAEAISKVGADGVVEVEEGKGNETTLDYVEGMQFDKGYLSPYFMTDPKTAECVLEDAYVLIYEKKIANLTDLIPLLNKVAGAGKPLLIIAEDVESEALAALVINRLRGALKIAAVKAPGFGDRRKAMLGDIGVLTNGTFFSEDLGRTIESIELSELGKARKIVITKDDTTIVEGAGKKAAIKSRADQIKAAYDKSTSDYDREKLQERLAKLTGGVAIINVGGATETAMKSLKDLVDDALHATRAAAREGYVPGGGVALLRAIDAVENAQSKAKNDEKFGYDIVADALSSCAHQIAVNAGYDGDVVVENILDNDSVNYGFNASTGEYGDMIRLGIIDPALVAKTALTQAASVAGLMLTTDVLITDLKEEEEIVAGAIA
ncbi:MAG: chaperonin GroEL [Phycisphaeraceae bacterium]|nr:chaperonin GroEL [Phycisphaerales bacterium]MCB9861474.1 chaperonin GroEL [Phycisphaeraceae bacterium]